jgi:RNA polymerase sigma factor (sigma-70 family)
MTEGKPSLPRSGADERSIVEEMIRDRHSKYWDKYSEFVKRCVYATAKNIPKNLQEEIIQEALYKVTRYLPHFRFQCALKTWLNQIIERCIIDAHRRLRNERRSHLPLANPLNESDREGEELNTSAAKSAEDAFETNDEIRNGVTALLEYANAHSNPIRDRLIIRMVIFEGHSQAETAKAAGCSAAVAGYVVREAQRYAREKMGHNL